MIEQFKRTLTTSCGVGRGQSVLVACSGGIDSMVLLRLMLSAREELDLKLHVVTVDHGLRCEAPGDAAFVLETCRSLGVEVSLYELGMDPNTPNLEEQARLKRYAAMYACRSKLGLGYMATGHTLDDQAETVLYRLARGTGLSGMQAMAYARPDGLIRPMLDITRAQVEAYARAQGIRFVTDQSNADLTLTRNLIRQRIMPLMRLINPRVEQALGRHARIAREEHALIVDQALALQDEALLVDWRICKVFDAARLMDAHPAVLKRLAMLVSAEMLSEPRGIEERAAEALMDVLQGRVRAHTLKRRVRVERGADYVVFARAGDGPFYETRVPAGGEYHIEQIGQDIRIKIEAAPQSPHPYNSAGLRNWTSRRDGRRLKDMDGLNHTPLRGAKGDRRFAERKLRAALGPLSPDGERGVGDRGEPFLIRSYLPGDRLSGKKVARLLADHRVIEPLRRFWPVLLQGDVLIAVAGIPVPGSPLEVTFPV